MDSLDSIRFGLELAGILLLFMAGAFLFYLYKSSRNKNHLD